MVERKRNVRFIKERSGPTTSQMDTAKKLLADIENRRNTAAKLLSEEQVLCKELEMLMAEANLFMLDGKLLTAEYKEVFCRGSTYIDPAKFREAVSDKEFMESVSITVKAAKELLPGKIFDTIAKVTKGDSKGLMLVLTEKKR